MKNDFLSSSVDDDRFQGISYPRVSEICRRLDDFCKYHSPQKSFFLSSMFLGALHAMRPDNRRSNPDWMSQVAHSLREIFYSIGGVGEDLVSAVRDYGVLCNKNTEIQKVRKYYGLITDIAHHNFKRVEINPLVGGCQDKPVKITPEIFEKIVLQFGDIIFLVLRRQIDAHQEIDKILKIGPRVISSIQVKDLIDLNFDARHYFYTKATTRWLNWLWEKGFLKVFQQRAEDVSQYGFRMPELFYLQRMSEKKPNQVTSIILRTPITRNSHNQEVIDSFVRICATLPDKQLSKTIEKIKVEEWIPLMSGYDRWGFECGKMLKTLNHVKNYNKVLLLSEAILSIRSDSDIIQSKHSFRLNPLYFEDLSHTNVFEYIVNIGDRYVEKSFALLLRLITGMIYFWNKHKKGISSENSPFQIDDSLLFIDIDFFSLDPRHKKPLSSKSNEHELAIAIKVLAGRLFADDCKDTRKRLIYSKYLKSLPDTRATWRLRLFVLSLCPAVFKKELKLSFFRLFDVENYYGILSGAEYLNALRNGFFCLSEKDKRSYVMKVIGRFDSKKQKFVENKQDTNKSDLIWGSKVLSMIVPFINKSPDLKRMVENAGFQLNYDYKPTPAFGEIEGGYISPRGPITAQEFNQLPVKEIAYMLRSEWTPEHLAKQNVGSDNFLNPLNAEGVGQQLQDDLSKRFQDYIVNANLFFNRNNLHSHYTYSFLRGVEETLKKKNAIVSEIKCEDLIDFFLVIKKSGESNPFETDEPGGRDSSNAWLAGWRSVHSQIADVIQPLLAVQKGSINFIKYRKQILAILSYLLDYPDPTPEDEVINTAGMKVQLPGVSDQKVVDPLSIAINSVRGKAFQTLVEFVRRDGEEFNKSDKVKISNDVKTLYEKSLRKENTRAIMFMFGHYLPTFYFCHKGWHRKFFNQIFPLKQEYLYASSWEGYLANNLYEEIFLEPEIQKLYERGIYFKDKHELNQEHFKQPDEGLAIHLSLAYIYYEKFNLMHPLLSKFFNDNTKKHHSIFISFIGRSMISSDNNRLVEAEKRGVKGKERIRFLWDWMLRNYKDPEPFEEFGSWVNVEKDIFEPHWLAEKLKITLEKTKGFLTWDHGLTKSIVLLSKESPEDTIRIAQWYLLEGCVKGGARHRPLILEEEWFQALEILHANPETQVLAKALISDLIRDGGSTFWDLKKILN